MQEPEGNSCADVAGRVPTTVPYSHVHADAAGAGGARAGYPAHALRPVCGRAGLASARLRQARDPDAWGVDALLEVAWSHLAEQDKKVQAYHAWFYRDRIGQQPPDAPCYRQRDGS